MLHRLTIKLFAAARHWRARPLGWLCLLLLAAPAAHAQYRFDSWTTANGMPNNSIWALLQTRDGYLWMTTSAGLVRFDGVRLTIFDKSGTPGITGNRFSALHEDQAGNLWAGTEDGGVIRYRDGVFTSWTIKDGLPSNRVERIDEDQTGGIWIFTDQGIAQWRNGQLTKVESFLGTPLKNLVTAKDEVYNRYRTGVWQPTADGWQLFRNGQWLSLPLPPPTSSPASRRLRYVSTDTRGRLWYGLREHPAEHYCVDEGQLNVFRSAPNPPAEFQQAAFYQDRQGRLWIAEDVDRISLWKDGKAVPLPRQ